MQNFQGKRVIEMPRRTIKLGPGYDAPWLTLRARTEHELAELEREVRGDVDGRVTIPEPDEGSGQRASVSR